MKTSKFFVYFPTAVGTKITPCNQVDKHQRYRTQIPLQNRVLPFLKPLVEIVYIPKYSFVMWYFLIHYTITWIELTACTLNNASLQVYIFHFRHNNNTIKYTIVSATTFRSFWLHVSTALRPSSGQHIQIKCLQCAYNMGSHSVYNCNVCNITTIKTYIYG